MLEWLRQVKQTGKTDGRTMMETAVMECLNSRAQAMITKRYLV